MKRFFSVLFGILFLLIGLVLAGTGTFLAAAGGTQGKITSPAGSVAGSGNALLFNDFAIDTGGVDASKFADMTVGAKSLNGKELFIGLGSTGDVITYLNDVPRDAVTNISKGQSTSNVAPGVNTPDALPGLSNGQSTVTPIPGSKTPAPPTEQTIWTNSAQGMEPSIVLPGATAGSTLVVMNLDGSPNVSIDLTLGVDSPRVFYGAIALIVVGIILIIIAILLFRKAGKLKRAKKEAKQAQDAAAAQPPAPGHVPPAPTAPGVPPAPPVPPQAPPIPPQAPPAAPPEPPADPNAGPQPGQPPQTPGAPPTPPAPGA